jgi:hypothetical protein
MQHSNAILAINSLDRYLSAGITTQAFAVGVTWLVATPNTITLGAQYGAVVGGTLSYPAGQDGWPAVGTVTITARNGQDLTIDAPVTANSGAIKFVSQTVTYNTGGSAQQPKSNILLAQYKSIAPFCNNFTISSPGALIYGYIDRIAVSQVQLQYNIPTICFDRNDQLAIWADAPFPAVETVIQIPFGFYTPDELVAAITALIAATPTLTVLDLVVQYDPLRGFTFESQAGYDIYFPSPETLLGYNFSQDRIDTILKTYKVFGMNWTNSENGAGSAIQVSTDYPNFLYTPYIDIYSDVLTNYQNIKDTNTSVEKPKGLVTRIYLSGVGSPQYTTETHALGSTPFVMTADLNTPKIIQWSPDVAVPSIDFQLRDCYGDFIPGAIERYPTEFQMTLLCIEADRR